MKIRFYFLLLLSQITFSQLSEKVNDIYLELNSKDRIESQNIGYNGSESDSYKLYEVLDSIASDEEILYMAQNGSNIVKGYLSALLVDRKSKPLVQLFSDYIKSNEVVNIQSGCVGYSSTIAGELYSYLFHQNEKLDFIKISETNSEELKSSLKEYYGKDYSKQYQTKWTKKSIDSLLTQFEEIAINYDSILPKTLNKIFLLNNYKSKNYDRIKYYAYKYPTREIMGALANYRKKKDLHLFHQNIDKAFLAISKFPDESFIKILEDKYEANTENLDYYEAISSICNDKINVLKKKIFEKLKNSENIFEGEYLQYLEESLSKYNCEYNSDLLNKIKELHNR